MKNTTHITYLSNWKIVCSLQIRSKTIYFTYLIDRGRTRDNFSILKTYYETSQTSDSSETRNSLIDPSNAYFKPYLSNRKVEKIFQILKTYYTSSPASD